MAVPRGIDGRRTGSLSKETRAGSTEGQSAISSGIGRPVFCF